MMDRRRRIEEKALATAAPILDDIGLEVVEIAFTARGRDRVLCLYIDRPGGGVTVDELQQASQAIEKALEVEDVVEGRYRLEVSSPGIDRPLKKPEDFRRSLGAEVRIRLLTPLPDGNRSVTGVLSGLEEDSITVDRTGGDPLVIPLAEVANARPVIDWKELLKKPSSRGGRDSHARRSS